MFMEFFVEEQADEETMMEMDGAGDGATRPRGGAQEDGEAAADRPRKRGVKPGSKRGPYRRRSDGARERIIESYRRGEN